MVSKVRGEWTRSVAPWDMAYWYSSYLDMGLDIGMAVPVGSVPDSAPSHPRLSIRASYAP